MNNLIEKSIFWVGGNDKRLALFENLFPVPNGVSYNSYLIKDDKTCLMDTVDVSVVDEFIQNIKATLGDKTLDYVVVQHMEPDHSFALMQVCNLYPNAKLVMNAKAQTLLKQFFKDGISNEIQIVGEGDELCLGEHTLKFVMTPMLHWPEVMMSYEKSKGILFSADAFGSFGSLDGAIVDSEVESICLSEMRRYYANIVGKYGTMVVSALKKLSGIPINIICPLHGLAIKKNLEEVITKYQFWGNYKSEEKGVLIVYASMHGNTKKVAFRVARELREKNIKVALYDVSTIDVSYLMAEVFKYSHILLASVTYNMDYYPKMLAFLHDMKALNTQNKTFAFIENGSWSPNSAKLMKESVSVLKNCNIIDKHFTITSAYDETQNDDLQNFIESVSQTL